MTATATNVPATLPPSAKNPSFWGLSATAVSAGGAVGVIVRVLTWPGAVMTDTTGVGTQVEVGVFEVELLELVGVLTTGIADDEVERVDVGEDESALGV